VPGERTAIDVGGEFSLDSLLPSPRRAPVAWSDVAGLLRRTRTDAGKHLRHCDAGVAGLDLIRRIGTGSSTRPLSRNGIEASRCSGNSSMSQMIVTGRRKAKSSIKSFA